jgi:hypothetical protein
MRKRLPLAILFAAAAFLPMACGKKTPVVPSLSIDAGFTLGDGGAVPEGGGAGAGVVEAGVADASVPIAMADAGASALPALVGPALDSAIDAALQAQAFKDAPGMTVEGQIGHATLAEGGTYNMLATLQPGRCYTFIAMSAALQVSTLEVKLMAPPLFNIEAGRSAATDKNPAILGRGKAATCPITPIALPYRVDVTARKGTGRVGIAVLSRGK